MPEEGKLDRANIPDPSGAGFFLHPRIEGVLIAGVEHSLWDALISHGVRCEFMQVHAALVEVSGQEPAELEFLALFLYWWVSRYRTRIEEDEVYQQFVQALERNRYQQTSGDHGQKGEH